MNIPILMFTITLAYELVGERNVTQYIRMYPGKIKPIILGGKVRQIPVTEEIVRR